MKHINGFDYLRALLSMMVVGWHIHIFGKSDLFDSVKYSDHSLDLLDIINFNGLLMAVPAFVFLSCYLYSRQTATLQRLGRRLIRICQLGFFWSLALNIWRTGYQGLEAGLPKSLGGLLITLLLAGDTPFYFFTTLALAILATHASMRLKTRSLIAGLFLGLLLVGLLPLATLATGQPAFSAYWNPLNFSIMPFAAVLANRLHESIRVHLWQAAIALAAAILLTASLEWHFYVSDSFFAGQGYALPGYSRVSLSASAVGLTLLFERLPSIPPPFIHFMSRYSLALYCIHPFLLFFVPKEPSQMNPAGAFIFRMIILGLLTLTSYAAAKTSRMVLQDKVLF